MREGTNMGSMTALKKPTPESPEVPPPLGHVHDRREAAQPLDAADRHATKALQKCLRGVRPRARQRASRPDPAAAVLRGS